jgi:prepilin peptidase dependent protein B
MKSGRSKRCRFTQQLWGFSLVEMMVAMAAGLLVVGAALTFTVAVVRANTENIQATRLTNDLRTALNLVVREVRRAGYDNTALSRSGTAMETSLGAQGTAVPLSAFAPIAVSGECIVFAYSDPAAPARQWKGFRREAASGTLQYSVGASAPDCSAPAGPASWVDLTDAAVVDITAFDVIPRLVVINQNIASNVLATGTTTTTAQLTLRTYQFRISGQLRGDAAFTRTLAEQVRVRGDEVSLLTP